MRRIVRSSLFALAAGLVAVCVSGAPASGQQKGNPQPMVRECDPKSLSTAASPQRTKSTKARKASEPTAVSIVCLEVKDEPLLTQEFLQEFVRKRQWTLTDEQMSEDTWTFSLYFSKEELSEYTKAPKDWRITWKGGKALVNVRTTELPDGYARVLISARFDGYGEPEDKFAPKRESWPLPTSGALEAAFLSALRTRFESHP